MRYSFRVVGDGSSYNDDDGMEFPTNEDPWRGAALAQEMAYDGSLDGFWILITNASADEISRIPIAVSNP